MTLRRGTGGDFRNLIVTGFPTERLDIREWALTAMAAAGRLPFAGLIAHRIGPGGNRYAEAESDAVADDGAGFDEASFLRGQQARLGADPGLADAAFNVLEPRFVPTADGPAARAAAAIPEGEYWDEGADFPGAFDPDSGRSWREGRTAFPDR